LEELRAFGKFFISRGIITSHATGALAQETVNIAGSNAVLLRSGAPKASVILMPGGDGQIGAGPGGTITKLKGNQLVRTRGAYLARGLAVLVVDAMSIWRVRLNTWRRSNCQSPSSHQPRTLRAAAASRAGKTGCACLDSLFDQRFEAGATMANILARRKRCRALVIEHRQDSCRWTLPAGVDPFIRWGRQGRRRRMARRWREFGRSLSGARLSRVQGLDERLFHWRLIFREAARRAQAHCVLSLTVRRGYNCSTIHQRRAILSRRRDIRNDSAGIWRPQGSPFSFACGLLLPPDVFTALGIATARFCSARCG
jgi:hypothetical protein